MAETQSLLEGAWERARAVAPASDCFVVAGNEQAALIRASLPELPAANLLIEPEPRDTSGAVAYAAAAILRTPCPGGAANQVMFVLSGDHVVDPVSKFTRCALAGAQAAAQLGALMTIGILPREPATAYRLHPTRPTRGAIRGEEPGSPAIYKVLQFREKPDRATAEKYVSSGEFYWNGGIFLWQLSTLLSEFKRQLEGHAAMIRETRGDPLAARPRPAETSGAAKVAAEHFPNRRRRRSTSESWSTRNPSLLSKLDFAWDDIGSWERRGRASGEDRRQRDRSGDTRAAVGFERKPGLRAGEARRLDRCRRPCRGGKRE